MRFAQWFLAVVAIGLAVVPTPVCADDWSPEFGAGAYLVALVILTGGVSLIVNSAVVAKGDGSMVWGWIGVVAGAATIATGASLDEKGWVYVAGGAAEAGMGVWSVVLAGRGQHDADTSRLEIGPGIAQRIDGTAEARLAMTLRF